MSLSESVRLPLTAVLLMWAIFGLEQQFGLPMSDFGIVPRTIFGLPGIFISPFVHGSISHLLSNTPTFFVLASSILFLYPTVAMRVFSYSYLIVGLSVWLLARPSIHIGASGLVYAFASFLFFSGIFRKNIKSFTISMVVAFLYSGMLYGIFPGQVGISWESHLIGAVFGIGLAWLFRKEAMDEDGGASVYKWQPDDGWEETGYRNMEGPDYRYNYKPTEKETDQSG